MLVRRAAVWLLLLFACAACATPRPAPSTTPPPSIPPAPSPGFRVVFIDVGQGDAELITAGMHNLLIDGGRDGPTIVRRLHALNVDALDAIVATHPDADHTGGLAAVLEAFEVRDIYVNGDAGETQTYTDFLAAAAAEPGALIHTVTRGDTLTLGDITMPVLNPVAPTGDTNNDSIVLRLACGAVSVLFTGDAAEPAEQSMLTAGLIEPTTILKAGDHGAATSSSSAFVRALMPTVAVISAGRDNAFGHPAAAAMARLAAAGATFEYTDTTSGDDSVALTSDCMTYTFSPPPTATIRVAGATTPLPLPAGTVRAAASALPPPDCYHAGANTCDCPDFSSRAAAQAFHDAYDPADTNHLDGPDHDGVVCESRP